MYYYPTSVTLYSSKCMQHEFLVCVELEICLKQKCLVSWDSITSQVKVNLTVLSSMP
jgi:hypothetical protein